MSVIWRDCPKIVEGENGGFYITGLHVNVMVIEYVDIIESVLCEANDDRYNVLKENNPIRNKDASENAKARGFALRSDPKFKSSRENYKSLLKDIIAKDDGRIVKRVLDMTSAHATHLERLGYEIVSWDMNTISYKKRDCRDITSVPYDVQSKVHNAYKYVSMFYDFVVVREIGRPSITPVDIEFAIDYNDSIINNPQHPLRISDVKYRTTL
jgi:hypothetical protein